MPRKASSMKSALKSSSKKRSVKFSKKRSSKKRSEKRSTKRSYKKKSWKKKPYKRFVKKAVTKRKPTCDVGGAEFLAKTAVDPAALAMYKSMATTGGNRTSSVTVHADSSVADVYNCKFRWCQNGLSAIPGSVGWYGNSIIDSGGSTDVQNCAYVPELGQLYLQYRVNSSKTEIHIQNISADDTNKPVTTILFRTIIPPASWGLALPLTLEGWITTSIPHKTATTVPGTTRAVAHISDYATTQEMFNGNANIEDYSALMPNGQTGQTGSAPNAPFRWYWGWMNYNYDGTVLDTGNVRITMACTYYTTLYAPVVSTEYQPAPEVAPTYTSFPEPPKPIYPKMAPRLGFGVTK